MSFDVMRLVRMSTIKDRTQFDVLSSLAFFLNDKTGKCCPSVTAIARDSRVSENFVRTALKALEAAGYISMQQPPGGVRSFTIHLDKIPMETMDEDTESEDAEPLTNPQGVTDPQPLTNSKLPPHESVRGGVTNSKLPPHESVTRTRKNKEMNKEGTGSLSPLAPASDDHAPTAAVDGELFPELEDYGPRMRCEPEKVRQLYNQILPELPECQILSKTRRTHIEARFRQLAKEEGFTTSKEVLDGFRIFFEGVKRSDFLMGRKDPGVGRTRAFRADLDWLMKESNFIKVCEGKYMNSNS